MSANGMGGGVKINKNYRRIVLKNCCHEGGGCQNLEKNADNVYRQPLTLFSNAKMQN